MKLRILAVLTIFANFVFSQNYHDTQGKFDVSSNGQATFTLPIAMPPTINNYGPKIDVNYTSGQISGIAGQGWSINGISKITRINTRFDLDGYVDGVDFDDNDKLALDGQRLITKTGSTYWTDGAIYQTEFQSNLKIQQIGSGANISFLVTTPDGTKNWYGKYDTNTATDLTSYCLVRTEDTDGNFITYNYTRPLNASLCIDNIQFSANTNGNLTPHNKIYFHYEQAPRIEKSYINGTPIVKIEILKSIEVVTNMTFFRKYEFTYSTDADGYSRLVKCQEFNGNNEAANPIEFNYNNQVTGGSIQDFGLYNVTYDTNEIKLVGDFDGDNNIDFINNNNLLHFSTINFDSNLSNKNILLSNNKKLVGSVLFNNKLVQHQSIINIEENIDNLKIKVNIFERDNGALIQNDYSKIINYDNTSTCVDDCFGDGFGDCEQIDEFGNIIIVPCDYNNCESPSKKFTNQYLEGDFNGDGLSEVLILGFNDINRYAPQSEGPIGRIVEPENPCVWTHEVSSSPMKVNLIDIRQDINNDEGTQGNVNLNNAVYFGDGKRYVIDYNGDGKSDILCFNKEGSLGFYRVLGFKQLTSAPWIELEVLASGNIDNYSESKQILFGDYNGDGKADFMLPYGECESVGEPACSVWYIYYANPNLNNLNPFVKEQHTITGYSPLKLYPSGQYFNNNYIPMDVNKDGKTDLVKIEVWHHDPSAWNEPTYWAANIQISSFINEIGNNALNNTFVNDYNSESVNIYDQSYQAYSSNELQYFSGGGSNFKTFPLVFNNRNNGIKSDIFFISSFDVTDNHGLVNHVARIKNITFNKDYKKNNLLTKISQSENKIVDEIFYNSLQGSNSEKFYGLGTDFYSAVNNINYPFVNLKGIPNSDVVSKITNTTSGLKRSKSYRYKNLAIDMRGTGMLGFSNTAQTSWYLDGDTKKTWSIIENDPFIRGALKRNFSLFLSQPFNFNISYINLISESNFNYETSQNNIWPYYALLKKETTIDYLTNVKSEKEYVTYSPDYFLPVFVTDKKYNGTTLEGTVSTTTYFDTPIDNSTSYIIGKPNEIQTKSEIYVNTPNGYNVKFSNQKLSYLNNRLFRTEKTSNGSTEKIVEEFQYFPNGLLQSKILKAENTTTLNAVASRTTEYTYDATNRFVKTVKNVEENLTTTYDEYDPIYGLVKKETNALGQSTLSLYDNWGKRTKVTDFLGKSITYTYSKSNGVYKTTQVGDDGSNSLIEQDVLSREIKSGSIDINGNWNYVNTEYDQYGRKYRVSEPYNGSGSPSQWSITEYDDYSRPIKQTAYTGKIVTTKYEGLTVTATEPTMSKSKTINALGFVISSTDNPGGTITYVYDANGNLLESDYESVKTKITYDQWNRKKTFLDTSLGLFDYSYDAFGQLKKEISPKGITEITYYPSGQIFTKSILGNTPADVTNIASTYTYDSFFRISKIEVVNPNDGNNLYEYFYDPVTKQLNKTVETLPYATFKKELTFDNYGRVLNEISIATAHSKTSSKTITHAYNNGISTQLLDGTNILWKANSVNSRGQLTYEEFGNGIVITNSYDSFGFLTQKKHDKTTTNVMTLNTVFEPVLGNLTSRYNSMFDRKEEFKYDNLDRLISWDGATQNILNLPFNTTTDGFTFTSTSTNGSVTNSAGTLKVVLKSPSDPDFPIAAQRSLALGLTNGDKINVKATIANKSGTVGVIVNAVMVETDPVDPNNYIEYVIGTIQNGAFEANYTVSDFVSNPTLKLRFVVSPDSPEGSNGGGPVVPNSTFYVDNLKIDKIIVYSQNYDDRGRITQNSIGSYSYNIVDGKPYQNNKVVFTPEGNAFYNSTSQDITYNAFKGAIQIASNSDKISYGYNAMEERSIMYWGNTNTDKLTRPYRRYYSADGTMEIKATFSGGNYTTPSSVEFITFVGGDAYSAPIALKSDGTTPSYFYLHRDYQGSIMAITNASGAVVEKRLFDPWGAIVKVQDGAGNNLTKLTFFDRGYTGHEHLESVGLIHMNARLYDPKLHRFLQADNVLQDPNNTQNYNRYGYCFNNPLKHTDPSGNIAQVAIGIIIAVALAVTTYAINVSKQHQKFKIGDVMTSATFAAFTSVATFGVGEFFASGAISNFYLNATVQAVAHGALQGTMAAAQGGKFWSSFASGAISSIVSSGWAGDSNHEGASGAFGFKGKEGITLGGTLFFGGISGGAGAALTGGNFWQGAVTGLVVSGLNHYMHRIDIKGHLKQWLEKAGVNYKDVPNMTQNQIFDLMDKVPELKQFYIESGCFDISVNLNYDDSATTGSRSLGCGVIEFGRSAFESMLTLGTHIIHETRHAWDFMNFNTVKLDKYNAIDREFKRDILEFRTYDYELKFSLPEYNQSGVNGRKYYYDAIKARGYDPLEFLN